MQALTAAAGVTSLSENGTAANEKGNAQLKTAAREPNASEMTTDTVLWYRRPASGWLEALPIGNGRLGAMIFGGIAQEKLQLNEGTLWAGGPHDYTSPEGLQALPEIRRLVFAGEWGKAQNLVNAHFLGRPGSQTPYQTVGNLTLTNMGGENASDYRRDLDLDSATARVSYTRDGVRYTREAFVSAVDQVMVLRLTADQPGKIGFRLAFDSPQRTTVATEGTNTLVMKGIGGEAHGSPDAVKFQAVARVLPEGGSVQADQSAITVNGANTATVLVSIGTSYRDYQDTGGDEAAEAQRYLKAAEHKSYARLREAHVADYRKLFRRVSIRLGPEGRPREKDTVHSTDERVANYKDGDDPGLAALHFQYGRYLLISCSRPGGQPATLQGLWNDSVDPPWGSKYTININTEMNYWPAAPTNLMECYTPLFHMISDLAVAGRRTAKGLYGANGWVCHHNTDAWRGTAPVDGSFWGMWPSGGAWLCKSLWDHYVFTLDRTALKQSYPLLKGAVEFFLDALVEEPSHHWLVTCPSISPENGHHPDASICAGPTMDMQILRDLFDAATQASEVLGVDAEWRARVHTMRARLAPMQIGRQGQLQEWLEDWDAGAPEQNHRHVSHLYGLFPSSQITKIGTPDLFAAARKSLETRGDPATGWSLAWKINLWARLQDGDRAHKLLADLLTPEHTAPNLFDLHPPFQIDGNFGAVSGVTEMMLQSHAGEIHLLPALPTAWPDGAVTGLRARGAFTVDVAWQAGKLTHASIVSHSDAPCTVRLGDKVLKFSTVAGKRYVLDAGMRHPPS